ILLRAKLIELIGHLATLGLVELQTSAETLTLGGALKILAISGFKSSIGAILGFARALFTAQIAIAGLSVPLLPLIAGITAVVGAVLLLQDVLVKGWEKSYLGRFVSWLLDKLPTLKSAAEAVGNAINWLRQGFDWLAKSIGGVIHWIQQAIDRIGPLEYIIMGPVGPIVYLITHIDKLKSATSSALSAIKSAWDATIGFIINKISELIAKVKQAWNFIAKSPIGKLGSFMFNPIGVIMRAVKIIQPKIKPIIEKPEMDKRFYEEGSVVLKVKTPKIKPEIEKPELSWLEQLYLRVKPLFEMTKIPELTGIIKYLPQIIQPEVKNLVAGITYVPKLIKPEISADLTKIVPTPSQLVSSTVIHQPTTYQIKHEHKTISVPKIEINVHGIKDPDEFADRVIKKIERKLEAYGA
ncbi:hypothetical protein DRP04_03275, partial [Archaeoglobales archaeon]